jgi:hypothetical protein
MRLIQLYAVYNDAEIGVVEVDKGVVAPPTPGTETWWRAIAVVREAVYALCEREACPVRVGGRLLDRSVDNQTPQSPTAKNGALFRFFPSSAFTRRRRTAPRFHPTPNEMNVKRCFKPTAEKTKNQRKT